LHDLEPEEVQRKFSARKNFVDFIGPVLDDMVAGRIGLIEARERVFLHCLVSHPDYLENISYIEKGRTIKVQLARNLMRSARESLEYEPLPGRLALLARLEAELAATLAAEAAEAVPVGGSEAGRRGRPPGS
jgi:hypothetical protein